MVKSLAIKSLLLAALVGATSSECHARWPDYAGFWVIGNRVTNECGIVTANPILPDAIFWFESGPYQSLDAAKLARSTISACPRQELSIDLGRNAEQVH
jgi:hypothetical protein